MKKYPDKQSRQALARAIAQEAMVLLKNDGILPLAQGTTLALLGKTQFDTVIGGGGSGSSFSADTLQINTQLEAAGLILEEHLKQTYAAAQQAALEAQAAQADQMKDMFAHLEGLVASGAIYEIFGRYSGPEEEPVPEDEVFAAAAEKTDTAILVIGRKSGGEECDRYVQNDYYLTESEKKLAEKTCQFFGKVIVILNSNGAVDLAWTREYPQISAILFMGTPGEQAAGALADILTGKVSPSGKLSQTFALSYEDYPTAETFSYDKQEGGRILTYEDYGLSAEENGSKGFAKSPVTLYSEGIYVGYRYFDTFGKPVLYPFGYGLSYADTQVCCQEAAIREGELSVTFSVTNLSSVPAKQAVEVFAGIPSGKLDQPLRRLIAVGKTDLIPAKDSCRITLSVPLTDLASFSEEDMAYIMEPGYYEILGGGDSTDLVPCASLCVTEEILVRKVTADMGPAAANAGKIDFLTAPKLPASGPKSNRVLPLSASDLILDFPSYPVHSFDVEAEKSILQDVIDGKVSMEAFVKQMSLEELAVLCNGYGPGLPFGGMGTQAPSTLQYEDGTDIGYNTHPTANPGYENPALPRYGIKSAFYKDGPASCGKTAWPTGMMISCTMNPALAYEFGSACGAEAEEQMVDSWLAPGMNIIRNPIEGRAFEYFSEDPYLAGVFGTAVAKGAIENNATTVCPKHFAMNEQETYRRGSQKKNIDAVDSIVSARAAREIYLKPFEMVITQAKPTTIMSSFNKINGTFAAGKAALCREILRGEWGYDGVVVTDWGDMDFVVDGADAVAAGNDVVMPGGPPVIAQVLKGYEEGRVTLDQMREAVVHLMNFVAGSASQRRE